MEKLRQDILSMFPSSSKSSNSYAVPVVTYKPETPEPTYQEPEPSYHEPEPSYNAPEPSYNAPEPSYNAPSLPTSLFPQAEGKPPVRVKPIFLLTMVSFISIFYS